MAGTLQLSLTSFSSEKFYHNFGKISFKISIVFLKPPHKSIQICMEKSQQYKYLLRIHSISSVFLPDVISFQIPSQIACSGYFKLQTYHSSQSVFAQIHFHLIQCSSAHLADQTESKPSLDFSRASLSIASTVLS